MLLEPFVADLLDVLLGTIQPAPVVKVP